ncbi:hypothetical protein QO011_008053 [Labrys wisconsinensis]|uniref:Uncharacterized protein n=1 Tax=Labrys wisconsinensis TaxID=425677 RepID=A0ABU0JL39_9HYPH|nr:hypothetical protein [Labrys wisconsinensis]
MLVEAHVSLLRADLRFVDEDQPLRVQIELALEPGLAPPQDVGTLLFGRMRRLFSR